MRIPLSVLTGFSLLMMMFFLMVELNGICFETYGAWHCYVKTIDEIENHGQESEAVDQVIEAGKKKGYVIRITKKGEQKLVTLEYKVRIPVLSVDIKQQISGYAH